MADSYPRLNYLPGKGWLTTDETQALADTLKQKFGSDSTLPVVYKANPDLDPEAETVSSGTIITVPGNPPAANLTGRADDEMLSLWTVAQYL